MNLGQYECEASYKCVYSYDEKQITTLTSLVTTVVAFFNVIEQQFSRKHPTYHWCLFYFSVEGFRSERQMTARKDIYNLPAY